MIGITDHGGGERKEDDLDDQLGDVVEDVTLLGEQDVEHDQTDDQGNKGTDLGHEQEQVREVETMLSRLGIRLPMSVTFIFPLRTETHG